MPAVNLSDEWEDGYFSGLEEALEKPGLAVMQPLGRGLSTIADLQRCLDDWCEIPALQGRLSLDVFSDEFRRLTKGHT